MGPEGTLHEGHQPRTRLTPSRRSARLHGVIDTGMDLFPRNHRTFKEFLSSIPGGDVAEGVAPEFRMRASASTPDAEGEIRVTIFADIPTRGRKVRYRITFPPVTHHSVTDRATFDRLLMAELDSIRRAGGKVHRVVDQGDADALVGLAKRFPEPFPPRPPKHRLVPRQGKGK